MLIKLNFHLNSIILYFAISANYLLYYFMGNKPSKPKQAKLLQYNTIRGKGIQETLFIIQHMKQPKIPQFKIQNNKVLNITKNNLKINHSQLSLNNLIQPQHDSISFIGLILCQYQQNDQLFNIYGCGVLIHNNIILTLAQNIYCRNLHQQYHNIKFIPGLHNNMHSGIYNVRRVYYPKEYTQTDVEIEKYNFGILQLYDDLSIEYGYAGLKIQYEIGDDNIELYGYKIKEQNIFSIYKISGEYDYIDKCLNSQVIDGVKTLSNSVLFIVGENNKYNFVGFYNSQARWNLNILTKQIKNTINEWATITKLNTLWKKQGNTISALQKYDLKNFQQMFLYKNHIDIQDCKYFQKAKWPHLRSIDLGYTSLSTQCFKYLSQAKWDCLIKIDLQGNRINDAGCKYLKFANWPHLTSIKLNTNQIGPKGCKYISEMNCPHLNNINLAFNLIDTEGCQYLKSANWDCIRQIYLSDNQIGAEGIKFLVQSNWIYLTILDLNRNKIGNQGYKYLRQSNWLYLKQINLNNQLVDNNVIVSYDINYLKDTNWIWIRYIYMYHCIIDEPNSCLLKSKWDSQKLKY